LLVGVDCQVVNEQKKCFILTCDIHHLGNIAVALEVASSALAILPNDLTGVSSSLMCLIYPSSRVLRQYFVCVEENSLVNGLFFFYSKCQESGTSCSDINSVLYATLVQVWVFSKRCDITSYYTIQKME